MKRTSAAVYRGAFCADAVAAAMSARAKTIGVSLNDLFISSVIGTYSAAGLLQAHDGVVIRASDSGRSARNSFEGPSRVLLHEWLWVFECCDENGHVVGSSDVAEGRGSVARESAPLRSLHRRPREILAEGVVIHR